MIGSNAQKSCKFLAKLANSYPHRPRHDLGSFQSALTAASFPTQMQGIN